MAKADNSHRSKKFSGFSKLLQEICEGFLQDSSSFDKDNSEKMSSLIRLIDVKNISSCLKIY